jgi:hypothetical protein
MSAIYIHLPGECSPKENLLLAKKLFLLHQIMFTKDSSAVQEESFQGK